MQLKKTLILMILTHIYQSISLEEATKLFRATLKQSVIKIKSSKEYEYRFKVFYQNLKEIENQKLEPKLDRKGRPLIGFSRSSVDNSKGAINSTYEKAVNKFSFLTDREFQNLFLMSHDVLFKNKKYLEQRIDPKYSFEEFKEYYRSIESSETEYEECYNDGKIG